MADEINIDDCIHGLPSFACSICLGRPPVPERSLPFRARYHGWCERCDSRIEEGDIIVAVGGEYVHEGCA
jgi:hypothetical protein